jgi:hypothetical protein
MARHISPVVWLGSEKDKAYRNPHWHGLQGGLCTLQAYITGVKGGTSRAEQWGGIMGILFELICEKQDLLDNPSMWLQVRWTFHQTFALSVHIGMLFYCHKI